MDSAYVTALAALVGTVFGSFSSFATTLYGQRSQSRLNYLTKETDKRESLYGAFLDEASRLFTAAINTEADDPTVLVAITALLNRMRLFSSEPVVEAADRAITAIVKVYSSPNQTLRDLDEVAGRNLIRPLTDFAVECRRELDAIK